jgi:hypothetical protein
LEELRTDRSMDVLRGWHEFVRNMEPATHISAADSVALVALFRATEEVLGVALDVAPRVVKELGLSPTLNPPPPPPLPVRRYSGRPTWKRRPRPPG